jgi:hypothetical protein
MTATAEISALEAQLESDIARFVHDPFGYVMFAFPWGEPDTPLEKQKGPRKWQAKVLKKIGATSSGKRPCTRRCRWRAPRATASASRR